MKKKFIISIIIAILLPILTIISEPYYINEVLVVDTGASVYQWKLVDYTYLNMILVWMFAFMHLFYNFYFIMKIKRSKVVGYSKYNNYLLLGNLFFILLHQLQTNIGYDGLAQGTPVFTSQVSVIIMLCLILIMLIPNRGLFLSKKVFVNKRAYKLLYSVHGVLFLIALVYTFWFHPMVFTWAHFTGFLYMFLLFVQASFINTKYHTNKLWIVILEVSVVIHAVSVAYLVQNSSIWPMFLFGFLFIFFVTQIYIFKIDKKYKYMLTLLYFISAFIFYFIRDISMIHQILWIPIIEYGLALLIILILNIYYKYKL